MRIRIRPHERSFWGTLDAPGFGWFRTSGRVIEIARWMVRNLWTEGLAFLLGYPIELVPHAGPKDSLHYYIYSERLFFDAMELNSEGVPQHRSRALGLFCNPAYVAWYGLMSLEQSLREGNTTDKRFEIQVEWLIRNAVERDDGSVVWPYPVDVREGRCTLRAPWISAMSQGLAISALVRAKRMNSPIPDLGEIALRAANVFDKEIHEGGVKTSEGGRVLYEEYPAYPFARVLDGFLFSLLGLYDLSIETGDPQVQTKFEDGVKGLVCAIDSWNYKDCWTWYGTHGYLSPRHYHDLNRLLVLALANITGKETLHRFGSAWNPVRLGKVKLMLLFLKFFSLKQKSRVRSLFTKIGLI